MVIALNRKYFTQALVLAGTSALYLGLGTGSAFAQDDEVEEIIVTGSRIARDPNLGAPVAVQSVTSEDIQLSGKMDVTDVIKDIPALMTSNSMDGSVNASAFDTASGVVSSSGESVLQLRGMGIDS